MKRAEWAFTAVALGAKTLERRISYRFGRWLGENTVAAHESFLIVSRRLGWLEIAPDLTQAALAATPTVAPECPSIFPPSLHVSRRASALAEGHCLLDDSTVVARDSLSWLEDPF